MLYIALGVIVLGGILQIIGDYTGNNSLILDGFFLEALPFIIAIPLLM